MKLTSNSKQGRVHVHVIIRGLGSRLVQRNFRWAQVLTIIMKVTVSPIPSRIQFHLSCTSPSLIWQYEFLYGINRVRKCQCLYWKININEACLTC